MLWATTSTCAEAAASKYLYTTIGCKDGDGHQIKDITIAGTTTKLVFD